MKNLKSIFKKANDSRIKTIESCPNEYVRDIFLSIEEYITRSSITIVGSTYYPEFNLFTITGDGFPQIRFVFNKDFTQVFFVFANDWKDNHKLQYAANPNGIPHIFDISQLENYLKRINI
jgi:hypothetical protein